MGVLSELGTALVDHIDKATGYPADRFNRLLSKVNPATAERVKDWDKPGTELYNLTNPYGFLEFAVGNGDDFWCFDYNVIGPPVKRWVILEATINSETGGFIEGGGYEVIPLEDFNVQAIQMVGDALEWVEDNNLRHTKRGWNQDPWYFARAVHLNVARQRGDESVLKFSERQKRFGGKKINRFCEIYNDE